MFHIPNSYDKNSTIMLCLFSTHLSSVAAVMIIYVGKYKRNGEDKAKLKSGKIFRLELVEKTLYV